MMAQWVRVRAVLVGTPSLGSQHSCKKPSMATCTCVIPALVLTGCWPRSRIPEKPCLTGIRQSGRIGPLLLWPPHKHGHHIHIRTY